MNLEELTVGVTGAGGFIGHRILERLAARDIDAVGLDVAPEAVGRIEASGARAVLGDTRDAEAVRPLAEASDVIIHTAAIVGEGGDWTPYQEVNVRGSRQVAATAAECGVRRLLHLSSVMVYGFDFPPEVDESGPLRGEDNPYCQTKIESERVVEAFHGRGDLKVTVVRPGDIYGPGSQPWVVRPLQLMQQGLFMLPDGGAGKLAPTWLDNLIDAFFLLLEGDHTGEAFNVTDGRTLTCKDFFSYHAAMLDRDRLATLPGFLLKPLFRLTEAGFRLLGKQPPATADAVHFLSKPHGYSNDKLRSLGFEPRVDLDEGMGRVETWARQTGLI